MTTQILIQDAESQEEVGYLSVNKRGMSGPQEAAFARMLMDSIHLPGYSLALHIKIDGEEDNE